MKHRQVGNPRIGIVNSDGHAIGIDIGATAVRAAILSHGTLDGRPSVSVHGLAEAPLPWGAVTAGVVADRNAVSLALRQMWAANRFECRNVILGITSQQIVVRDLAMPDLPHDQMAKALPYQARDLIPLPLDQVLIDYVPLGLPDPSTELMPGLLIATPRQPVAAAVEAVERAGLRVARVDLSTFAALRSIAAEALAVEAVVDLGAHVSNVIIHSQGVPRVVRSVPRGGQELTDRVAAVTGFELAEAEAAKRAEGLVGSNRTVVNALEEALRPLISELRSSVQYFESTSGSQHLARIALTGGGAALAGLPHLLGEQLGVPTGVVEPMQHVRNRLSAKAVRDHDAEAAASAVSVGLAMGAAA